MLCEVLILLVTFVADKSLFLRNKTDWETNRFFYALIFSNSKTSNVIKILIFDFKSITMKIFLTLAFLMLCQIGNAQKVFSTQYANQAEVKVFVVKYENQADLKVYKVKYENQAGDNNGKWFFTQYVNQAKTKIFFVDYENQADLKIYFVPYENQAGWRNNEKKHLLY